jgi:hypothetical protein
MLNELTKIEHYLALGLAILVVLAGVLLAAWKGYGCKGYRARSIG